MKNSLFVRLMAAFVVSYVVLSMDDSWAATLAAACPDGWYAVEEPYITIDTVCATGYEDFGVAESCEVTNPNSDCYLFAVAGVSYSDASGTFEYTESCDEFEESSSSSS